MGKDHKCLVGISPVACQYYSRFESYMLVKHVYIWNINGWLDRFEAVLNRRCIYGRLIYNQACMTGRVGAEIFLEVRKYFYPKVFGMTGLFQLFFRQDGL